MLSIPPSDYHYHGIVLSNYYPSKVDRFQWKISQHIQNKYNNSSLFLKFHFNIPDSKNGFDDYIKYIDKDFGDVENCQFHIQKKEANGQKIVVLTWKNINRFRNKLSGLYN